jgi:molecular chaperone GrpE
MANDREKGSFSTDIPDDAIAEAVAAVEKGKRTRAAAESPEAAEVSVEVEPSFPAAEAAPRPADAARIQQMEAELADGRERLLRVAADFENYKKRAAKEREDTQRFGNEKLVKEMLPVLDNLDRALAAAPKDDPLVSGVEMTRRLLEEALARFGVKAFSAKGQQFDARVHEALMAQATDAAPPGTVIEEQQRGFFLNDRLIRPAAVVVAAAPAKAKAETDAGGDPEAVMSAGSVHG